MCETSSNAQSLSAMSSIITVLQLSAKVLGYLSAVRDASKNCTQCAIEVSNLYSLLSKLRGLIDEGDAMEPWYIAVQDLAATDGPLDQFKQALEMLENRMTDQDGLGKKGEEKEWKLSKEEFAAILSRMERLKSLVEIALQMDYSRLSQAVSNDKEAIREDTNFFRMHVPSIQPADKIQQDEKSEKHRKLLEWISSSDYPTQQYDIISHRQKGTGEWFLAASELTKWLREPKTTLFCPGILGAGKTMMSAIVIDHLLNNTSDAVVHVFFDHEAQEEQNTLSILAAILKQLVQAHPSIMEPAERLQKKCTNRETRPILDEVFSTLKNVLTHLHTVYIVLDALDECRDSTRRQVLAKLRDLQAGRDIRLMVTSRPTPEIVAEFREATSLEVRASEEDVKQFVAGQIFRLPRCIQHDPTLQEMVQEKVVNTADGVFLLAHLHIDSLLDKKTRKEVKSALDRLSKGSAALDDAYQNAIHTIEGQSVADVILAKKVLSWVTFAKRPLLAAEICCALAVQPGDVELDPENIPYVEDLVSICAGLVVVDPISTIIRLVHSTAQEYFERTGPTWNPTAQVYITSTCLTYLSYNIFKKSNYSCLEDYEESVLKSKFRAYAVKHWGEHALPVESEVCDLARSFLSHSESVSCATEHVSPTNDLWKFQKCFENRHDHTGLHLTARFGLTMISESIMPVQPQERGTELRRRNVDNQTPLDLAAEHGHYRMVEMILNLDTGIDPKSGYYDSALQDASYKGHNRVVQLLLDRGAKVDAIFVRHGNSVAAASAAGHEQTVRLLVDSGANVNAWGGVRYGNALYQASVKGHENIVRLLVDLGADVNLPNGGRYGNALQAASYSGHERIVSLLVDYGADVNTPDGRNGSALQGACYGGFEQIVKLLVDKGADVDMEDGYYGCALQAAAHENHTQVLRLLIDSGADVNLQCGYYGTALQAASLCHNEENIRLLLDKGADVNVQGGRFGNAFQAALVARHDPIVTLLLDHGADVNAQGGYLGSALQAASFRGNGKMVKLLLEHGAEVNMQGGRHGSAFNAVSYPHPQQAMRREQLERLLINNGAIVDTQNRRYSSALYAPSARGHRRSIKILQLRE